MQFQVCESDALSPGAQRPNPEWWSRSTTARRCELSGLVLVRLIERLGVASAIDAGLRVLRRCKWYRESDR